LEGDRKVIQHNRQTVDIRNE